MLILQWALAGVADAQGALPADRTEVSQHFVGTSQILVGIVAGNFRYLIAEGCCIFKTFREQLKLLRDVVEFGRKIEVVWERLESFRSLATEE